MSAKQYRIEAIRRVAQGESITDVCTDLKRSRGWYYKWLNVFRSAGVAGLARQRGGQVPGNATPDWLKELIVEIRDRLVEQAQAGISFQGIGAREVASEVEKLSIDTPHWTTVHRILKRAGRIAPTTQCFGYCPRWMG
jgi:transposase